MKRYFFAFTAIAIFSVTGMGQVLHERRACNEGKRPALLLFKIKPNKIQTIKNELGFFKIPTENEIRNLNPKAVCSRADYISGYPEGSRIIWHIGSASLRDWVLSGVPSSIENRREKDFSSLLENHYRYHSSPSLL